MQNMEAISKIKPLWDREDKIRSQILQLESLGQKQYDIVTWRFRRTWGRLLKMLFQRFLVLILHVLVLPFALYCKVRGLDLDAVLRL